MKYPNFFFERRLWEKGYKFVAGCDEVGRGSFAGPIVAGCIIFALMTNYELRIMNNELKLKGIKINDSKKLTARQRERADSWIKRNAAGWGTGEESVASINKIGIGKAAKRAFRKAISEARKRLGRPIDYLLIDAFFIPYTPGLPAKRKRRQLPIIDGDAKSLTIGAASIIAKVYRDRLMSRLSKQSKFKKYGWGRNKGYGTAEHQTAILRFGITRNHRKLFLRKLRIAN